MQETGKSVSYMFDAGALGAEDVTRITADIWADLPFDRESLAALKRDGLTLDGINLGGPNPFHIDATATGEVRVSATGDHADILLDLWRIHFQRGLRPRTLAA